MCHAWQELGTENNKSPWKIFAVMCIVVTGHCEIQFASIWAEEFTDACGNMSAPSAQTVLCLYGTLYHWYLCLPLHTVALTEHCGIEPGPHPQRKTPGCHINSLPLSTLHGWKFLGDVLIFVNASISCKMDSSIFLLQITDPQFI
jgi:hypothetical protein